MAPFLTWTQPLSKLLFKNKETMAFNKKWAMASSQADVDTISSSTLKEPTVKKVKIMRSKFSR